MPAIANATMPIFVVLLAIRFKPSETVRGLRLVGFLVGLVGVLAGIHPESGWCGAAGTLAVVVASASYAVGALWGQRLIARTSRLVLSATSMIGGLLVVLPLGVAQLLSRIPGWKETGSVAALAVIRTALRRSSSTRVLRSDGAARRHDAAEDERHARKLLPDQRLVQQQHAVEQRGSSAAGT